MSDTGDLISVAVQANVPALIWGAPGVGKTSFVTALAQALKRPIETVIASIREPSDFCGLPVVTPEGVRFVAPAWAERIAAAGTGIVFFDEISTAAPACQAGLLRVILERVVGECQLSANVSMLGAANPPERAAGGWDLSAPLANRFCHVSWEPNVSEWVEGMIEGWPVPQVRHLPEAWAAGIPAEMELAAAFVHRSPGTLLVEPTNAAEAGKAWPSPRTWKMTAHMLAACAAMGVRDTVAMLAVAGCLGPGVATEYLAWRRDLDLPDPEVVLKEPEKFELPKRGDQQFAVLSAVAATAARSLTPERWDAAWTVMARAADQGAKDTAAVAVRTLAKAGKHQMATLKLPLKQLQPFVSLLKAVGAL